MNTEKSQRTTDDGRRVNDPWPSSIPRRLSSAIRRPLPIFYLAFVLGLSLSILLTACTDFRTRIADRLSDSRLNPKAPFREISRKSATRNPKWSGPPSIVLPQPTPATRTRDGVRNTQHAIRSTQYAVRNTQYATRNTQSQIVEIRISHVRDLREIRVQAGDTVTVGQVLAHLEGYAKELNWEVQLIALELTQARAKLTQAQAEADAAREEAAAAHAQQVTEAEARVTALERQVATLQRQQQIATARVAQARATTEYRQRWLDTLEPLQDFDPWGDLPYLVGSQNGPRGPRSDLAYREALAKAEYDLHLAELAQRVAELEAADATARLEGARADLKAARAALNHIQAAPQPSQPSSNLAIYESSVRINELRLARARAELQQTVVKSLVTGKVLDVRIERVDGNEATVVIRIAANVSR